MALLAGAVLGAAVPAAAVPEAAVQTTTAPGFAPRSVITWLYDGSAQQRSGVSFDVGIGRGWMVVHEVLHSLGLGHSDEEGSVMSPVARITNVLGRAAARREQRALPRPGFTPGDLAALAAMYPRAGCPATPGVDAS